MEEPAQSKRDSLEALVKKYPHINHAFPSSPNYTALRAIYNIGNTAVPFAIACPQTARDVAVLVTFATSQKLGIVVRTGGNDPFGRCMADGALVLDLRGLDYVDVDREAGSARVGGGILAGSLASALAPHGLVTATGAVPFVGYVGWATLGGYGPFSTHYGLGVDQIVGATVVNSKAEIVEADGDMLRAIRGAGGSLGVIVEMKIKVYPLKKVLAGMILFDSTDIIRTFKQVSKGLGVMAARRLPDPLGIQPIVVNSPAGRMLGVEVLWSSPDHKTGRLYVDEIAALANPIRTSVVETTVPEWMQASTAVVSPQACGTSRTVSVRNLTEEVADIIARNIAKMPTDRATAFSIHGLRGSPALPNAESVFGAREPHFVLELIATASDLASVETSQAWAVKFRDELLRSAYENILFGSWVPLTPTDEISLLKTYGSHCETLLELKRKHDPRNVFKLSVPSISL